MRITTQMLNESARKAGLPIGNISLLNYIKTDEKGNTLLDALNKNIESSANSAKKSSYEKLDKEADKLTQVVGELLQEGDSSLFEQAKVSADNQKVYDSISGFLDSYNSTLNALRSISNTMTDFYRETMLETAIESKEDLSSVGITFAKDGTASVNMEKIKSTDIATLESLLGPQSEFVNKVGFLSDRISNNAEANVESLSCAYNAGGNLYSLLNSNKYDFLG